MSDRLQLFVATKGHPFQRDAFEAMLRAIGVEPTMVDHPAAAMLLNPQAMRGFDAILLYDMPGMDFRAPVEDRPALLAPDPAFVGGFEALLAEGKGIVALHHALAGWPAWPRYAEILGGSFRYRPGVLRGKEVRDSRYAPNVRYVVRTVRPGHSVLSDVPDGFELCDELYDCELFDDRVEPLIVRETVVPADNFRSAMATVRRGTAAGNSRPNQPEVNPLLGWATSAGNSPIIYLQPGDGPATYEHSAYRTLVGNAVRWVASPEARLWAANR